MGVIVECHICGAKKKMIPAKYKQVMNNTGLFFCSREHYWVWRRGDGWKHFSAVFKKLAKVGNTKAANDAVRGKPTWNKGLSAQTDERMEKARENRIKYYGGTKGLSEAGRLSIIKCKHGFYRSRDQLPIPQRMVLEITERLTRRGDVEYEHFALIGEDRPIFIDVVVLSKKLAIEVDGVMHRLKDYVERDRERDDLLLDMGWKVLRFWNDAVIQFPKAVESAIKRALA